jgi:Putative adhesin
MMNDQEMQFADPEWRPRQGQNGAYDADAGSQPYNPQPVNADRPQWEEAQREEPAERVYMAQELPPYQAPPPQAQPMMGGQYHYEQVRPQRRRSPWVWIVLGLIILSILGSTMHSFGGMRSSDRDFPHMKPGIPVQQQGPFAHFEQHFNVGSQPTIVINDQQGDVHIQGGGEQNVVTIQSDGPGMPAHIQKDINSLQINVLDPAAGDITVTVPSNANLVIITDNGDVNVENVSGQMTVTSGSGSIEMHKVVLTGDSTIKSGDGHITFEGQLDPNGSYQFISTNGGSIDLTMPSDSAFHLNATTKSGNINASDFPQVQVQQSSPGSTAHGDVGNAPRATLTITAVNGDISLNAQ